MRKLASRIDRIRPFMVMELLARARELEGQGRRIIHMEIGEPDFPTPDEIARAGMESIAAGRIRYTPAAGLAPLRQAISAYYDRRYGVEVGPERVFVTPGASGAFLLALSLLLEPGGQVLMGDPGYPCNRNFVHLFEGRPLLVPVGAESNYQLTRDLIRHFWEPQSSGVWITSPANPTGSVIEAAKLAAICEEVTQRGGFLLSDEIYHGLEYGERCVTALELGREPWVVNSFSKFFGMTGWRLGWLIVPDRYIESTNQVAQNVFISAPAHSQYAALSAFESTTLEELEKRRRKFEQRGDFLYHALMDLGFVIDRKPQGAFYLYADCSPFSADSRRFCWDLLEQTGVAVTPGCDFGEWEAANHVRFAYTTCLEDLQEGVDRIKAYIRPFG